MMDFLNADLSLGANMGAGAGAGPLPGALESGAPLDFADLLAARKGAEALGGKTLEAGALEAGALKAGALALADEGDEAATDILLAPPALAAAPLAASRLNRLAALADWAALPAASVAGPAEGAESGRAAPLSDAGKAGEPELLTQRDAGVAPARLLVVPGPDALAMPKAVEVAGRASGEGAEPRVAEAVVGSAVASVRTLPPDLALATQRMGAPQAAGPLVLPIPTQPPGVALAAQSMGLPVPAQPPVLAEAGAGRALSLAGPDGKPGPQNVMPAVGVRGDTAAAVQAVAVAPVGPSPVPVAAAPVTVAPVAAVPVVAAPVGAALPMAVVPVASARGGGSRALPNALPIEVSGAASVDLSRAPANAPVHAPFLDPGVMRRGLGAPEAAPALVGAERTLVGAEPVLVGAGLPVVGASVPDASRALAPAEGRGASVRAAVVDQGLGAGLGLGPVAVSASLEGMANVRMALSGGRDALQVALMLPDAVAATARARSEDLMGALADQGVRLAALSVSAGGAAQGSGSERGQERGLASDGGGPFQNGQQAQQQARNGGQAHHLPLPVNPERAVAAGAGLAAVDEMTLSRPVVRGADRFA
jgi:hypothetical protein